MPIFWISWACLVFGILLIASLVELNGARKGFHGANGIFLFSSCYLTVLTSPVPFIVTWAGVDLLTAFQVCAIGAIAYAVLFAGVLRLMRRLGGSPS
jgi:hypothetical protein